MRGSGKSRVSIGCVALRYFRYLLALRYIISNRPALPVGTGLANHDHDKEQQTDHGNSTININTTMAGWLDVQNQHEHDNAGNKQMAEGGITTQRG